MHRLMMTSATYRQTSAVTPSTNSSIRTTPLSRMPLVRLDAEPLYDTLLLVAGRLDETRVRPARPGGGPGDGLVTPAGTVPGLAAHDLRAAGAEAGRHASGNFDFPQMNPNCLERRDSTVAPQALHLMNNGMVAIWPSSFARRVSPRRLAPIRRGRSSGST